MNKKHIILTKQEAETVQADIEINNNGVLDKFKYGGWTINTKATKLKDGTFALSRELIEELEKRGGNKATKIAGVDLKNRPDKTIKDSDKINDKI